MKTLLRSTFGVAPTENKDLILRNIQALRDANLVFDIPEDEIVWKYIQDFSQQYHHAPEAATIRGHFAAVKQLDVVDRLDSLAVLPLKIQGDFGRHLEQRVEDRRVRQVGEILREAARIVETGITVKEGKKDRIRRGPTEAIRYVMDRGHEIVTPVTGVRLTGDVTSDGDSFLREVERMEQDPLAGIGQYSGIEQMDILKGAKRGELWTHAGFTGGMKSTLALNWLYNQAVFYKHSSVLFSLEMPYPQVRRILYGLHSFHEKFTEIRKQLGIKRCLEYQKIRDGELSPEERKFLFEYVTPDFNDPNNQYGSIHVEVADPDKTDFTIVDLRAKAEILRAKDPAIAMLCVDHAGLMASRERASGTTEKLNEVIRDLKRLAMSFDRGAGIAVLNLFQINREGFKAAEKNGGKYNLTHLSYANECCVEGTLIPTGEGLLPIEEVLVGNKVWSRTGWKIVQAVFNQGVREVCRITADNNSILEVTPEHLVRVAAEEGFGWKETKDLLPGDFLVSSREGWEGNPEPVALPALTFQKWEKPCGDQGYPITVPTHMNEDLAYLLGEWDGDGCNHTYQVKFVGNLLEQTLRDRIRDTFSRVFTHELGLDEFPENGSFYLTKDSQPLTRWFRAVAGERAGCVPKVVFQSNRNIWISYLKGLFDADGCVNSQGIVSLNQKGSRESFVREVQFLLSALGIPSHFTFTKGSLKKTGKIYVGCEIRLKTRRGVSLFKDLIGFTEPWKQERLEGFVSSTEGSRKRESLEHFPFNSEALSLYRKLQENGVFQKQSLPDLNYLWEIPHKAKNRKTLPIKILHLLCSLAEEAQVEIPTVLKEAMGLRFLKVKTVTPLTVHRSVWDLEVGGDQEYQTGPFLSHNCERSSDIVTAGYIDDELRSRNLLKLQCLKSRDDSPFSDFYAGVVWACRRIHTAHDVTAVRAQRAGDEIDLLGG